MINSTAYYNDFWNEMRGKQAVTDNLYNNRESKTNAYHLPGESNKKYTDSTTERKCSPSAGNRCECDQK